MFDAVKVRVHKYMMCIVRICHKHTPTLANHTLQSTNRVPKYLPRYKYSLIILYYGRHMRMGTGYRGLSNEVQVKQNNLIIKTHENSITMCLNNNNNIYLK